MLQDGGLMPGVTVRGLLGQAVALYPTTRAASTGCCPTLAWPSCPDVGSTGSPAGSPSGCVSPSPANPTS